MAEFLKGNFKAKRAVAKGPQDRGEQINEEFERSALKRLGGSIAFVSRKGFLWKGDGDGSSESGDKSGPGSN